MEIDSMGMSLEQENALRRIKGEPLLDKLPEEAALPSDSPPSNPPLPEETTTQKTTTDIPALNSESVLAFLKQQGIEVGSLDDLRQKPTEDPEKAAEEREAAILTYGLQKGKFNTKTYESFIQERSNLQDVVFQQYRDHAKQEDSELTDEEIIQEFTVKFGLDAEAGTRKHKRGQQEIAVLANNLLQHKYANIFSTHSEYTVHEQAQRQKLEQENRIKQGLPAYKQTVDKVFESLKKIPTKFSDESEFSVDAAEIVKDSIQELHTTMTSPEYVAKKILEGYTVEQLQQEASMVLMYQKWPVFAEEISKQYLLKHKAGTQGIPPKGPVMKTEDVAMTEDQKAAYKRIFPETQLAN